MRRLRASLLWIGISIATVLFGLPAIAAAWVPPRGDWFLRFARGWARTILFFSGVRVRVLHPERLAPDRSVVLIANHESFADILVLLANVPFQVRFLAKRGVFRVPVLGWSIGAAGFVPVDRGDRARGGATFDAALARLAGGRSLVIFPEETRTTTGDLLPFKKGAALLAIRSGLPLLPVGLAGTLRVLPRDTLLPTAGPVVLAAGDPISVDGLSAKDRNAVNERARTAVEALRAEAREAIETEAGGPERPSRPFRRA